jgi:formylglycine-generating enzyme required for sulfatase activity
MTIGIDVEAIPGGTFLMGSPEDDAQRYLDEQSQHEVTVPPFFMGRYPITQAQWRAVANLPQVERELNPAPSIFKGDRRPVENVGWLEAMEFCARLSAHAGQTYTLPSGAQWEYACRAGTTTPFHFGETITTDLANYNGRYTYGANGEYQSKGKYREQTTDVGTFPPNDFGLYDMHGNVWEWCLDSDTPVDESWVLEGDGSRHILRGGCWFSHPRLCRCTVRIRDFTHFRRRYYGFRVVGMPPTAA